MVTPPLAPCFTGTPSKARQIRLFNPAETARRFRPSSRATSPTHPLQHRPCCRARCAGFPKHPAQELLVSCRNLLRRLAITATDWEKAGRRNSPRRQSHAAAILPPAPPIRHTLQTVFAKRYAFLLVSLTQLCYSNGDETKRLLLLLYRDHRACCDGHPLILKEQDDFRTAALPRRRCGFLIRESETNDDYHHEADGHPGRCADNL